MRAARALLWALALASLGCAVQRPRAYEVALASGSRAHRAGRWREAAEAYDRAARETRRPLDRDEAIYRAGQAWRRAGEMDLALARFEWLAAHGDRSAREPRGALEAVRLRFERGEREQAEADVLALVRRAPTSGSARRALELLLLERDGSDGGTASALAWLEAHESAVTGTVLEATLLAERARRLERLGRVEEAVATFERLLRLPYPLNPRWDDGGLAYVRLLQAADRPAEAVRVAERVLAVRETSVLPPGSYERPHFAEVQWRRAEALRDGLHDPARAAEAFHTLYASFPASTRRDDALREEAALRASMGERARACELYVVLAREFPCTRHGRYGREQAHACGQQVPGQPASCGRARSDGGEESDEEARR